MAERRRYRLERDCAYFRTRRAFARKPDCMEALFPAEMGGDKHIAEMAHVIPHGDAGPRHEDRPADDFDPDAFENLILLCPTCHTKIDKDPETYPRNILIDWKANHLGRLAHRQGIRAYDEREQARAAIAGMMAENRAIWEKLAPGEGSYFEYDPESGTAAAWDQRMRSVILRNHYRTLAVIEANLGLATDEERCTFAEYQEHVRGLSERHICGVSGRAIRFPGAMEGMFA